MPTPRTAASFEPLPPDLDLAALVEATENFEYAVRLSCDVIDSHGIERFEKLVLLHVIIGGKPLVIEGFQNRLDQWTFSTQWLRNNVGKKFEQARDLTKGANLPLSINHYIENMPMLTNQWTPQNYKTPKQRLYLKDIDCPELWQDKLREHIPSSLFYLNECKGEAAGQSNHDNISEFMPAGDLMSCLPPPMRAENMMCYIGHEGTYTPAHREMCASLGQNIMVEASGSIGEDGKPTKPGSSIWFMTESKDRHLVAEYWLSTLGHDIEVEAHFAQLDAWAKAPFKVYIVEQRVGDFILIPPLAPHQVWNRGTRTMKAAWNRTTVETLEMALSEALPRARMVCRDEQYKNKAIVLFSLNRYSTILKNIEYQKSVTRDRELLVQLTSSIKTKQLQKDFKRLFRMFNQILLSEMFSPSRHEKKVEYVPFDGNITCSYCRCNIFNRFLTCKNCIILLDDGGEDTYDICMECFAMGRSCLCISKLSWVEQFPWKDLLRKHENWRKQLFDIEKGASSKIPIPMTLEEERRGLDRKSLAEVCQEQLRLRPYQDPAKKLGQDNKSDEEEEEAEEEEEEKEPENNSRKPPKRKRSEKWLRENIPCHICQYRHPKWKMAVCECEVAFCYGSLWRGFDIMPQTIIEDPFWRCPKCREICNCSQCRKRQHNEPYQPSGTILGHDTRKFADPRSIEALVDFSSSNSHWLKKAGDNVSPTETRRMQRRIFEAEHAKLQQPTLDDEDAEEAIGVDPLVSGYGHVPIDPVLVGAAETINDTNWVANNSRRVAQDALSAMDSLHCSEQNPEAFIAQAALEGTILGHKDKMIRNSSNGISHGPSHLNKVADNHGKDKSKTPRKRSKRGGGKPHYKQKLDNEAALFANDANRRFYQSKSEKTMAEARKTGRLISAKAAITGDRLIVKLKVGAAHLVRFGQAEEPNPSASPAIENDVPAAQVQSDLPKITHQSPSVAKRRYRTEKDDEFGAVRKRRKRIKTYQHSTSSEDGGDQSSNSENDARIKPVSLPAYLARRSPIRESELPKELAATDSRRSAAFTALRGRRSVRRISSRSADTAGASTVQIPNPSRRNSASYSSSSSGVEQNNHRPARMQSRVAVPECGTRTTRPALTTHELNRRAKLRAVQGESLSSYDTE